MGEQLDVEQFLRIALRDEDGDVHRVLQIHQPGCVSSLGEPVDADERKAARLGDLLECLAVDGLLFDVG